MGFFKKIKNMLSFSNQQAEFELLETENGQPGYFGGWHDESKVAEKQEKKVSADVKVNEERLKFDFRADINPDLVIRQFMLGGEIPAIAAFLTGMASGESINDFILRDGMRRGALHGATTPLCEYAVKHVFTLAETDVELGWDKVTSGIKDGKTAVFIHGEACVIMMDTRGFEHRSVSAPQNEKSVRGPQEGFSENLRTSITLIRRIMKTSDLICEIRDAGADNNIKLAMVYRAGITNQALVQEVKRRIGKVSTRMILSAGVMEQLTEENRLSPFPQVLVTERPDRVVAHVMQGHVAVLLDGSPFAIVMPITLHALMASPEDTYLREPQGTVIRTVRYIGAIISVLLPAYFLAMALHHQGLLSVEVLSTLVSSRKMVFAPLGSEMIFLLVVFQLIREAGLRVPGSIGQAIGIIGGLILGQAAVTANLASSVVLIIVALSGLGNFCIPDYSTQIAVAIFRLLLVLAAWLGGFLGFTCVLLILMGWMCSLKSYGVPFLAPFSPKTYSKYPFISRGRITQHSRATDFTNTQEDTAK
ncbi:MAG: spore germination protein [Clostridia bacterium]